MHEVYVAAHARESDAWRVVMAPAVLPPADLRGPPGDASDWDGWRGAGNGFAAYPELAAALRLGEVDAAARPTAAAVGEIAAARLAAGEGVAAGDALPLYVRHRVALTTAERDAGQRL
jgi:tRNA threonylcarbamoyladenosine biosynthesis protein TsaB